jgi:hypothetical protein
MLTLNSIFPIYHLTRAVELFERWIRCETYEKFAQYLFLQNIIITKNPLVVSSLALRTTKHNYPEQNFYGYNQLKLKLKFFKIVNFKHYI